MAPSLVAAGVLARKRAAALASIVAYAILHAGCSTTSSSAVPASDASAWDGRARSPCSTGPAYADADALPRAPFPEASVPPPRCIPRCDAEDAGLGVFFYDSIPSGPCSVDHEECRLLVDERCPCGGILPHDDIHCECTGGSWQCLRSDHALLGICDPCETDAGIGEGGRDSG